MSKNLNSSYPTWRYLAQKLGVSEEEVQNLVVNDPLELRRMITKKFGIEVIASLEKDGMINSHSDILNIISDPKFFENARDKNPELLNRVRREAPNTFITIMRAYYGNDTAERIKNEMTQNDEFQNRFTKTNHVATGTANTSWDYDTYTQKDPKGLMAMIDNDPDHFIQLIAEKYGQERAEIIRKEINNQKSR